MISESASHSTPVSAVSYWNIQRDGLDSRPVDTPIPKKRISDGTLNLYILSAARSKLTDDFSDSPLNG